MNFDTPEYLAAQARLNAANKYRSYAVSYLNAGDGIHSTDPEGAKAHWLDGMNSLDAAFEVEKGLDHA